MCTSVKSPTPKEPEKKNPVYMRNPYLDGLGVGAESRGRNSLRIDPGTPAATQRSRTVPRMGYDDAAPVNYADAKTPLGLKPGGSTWRSFAIAASERGRRQ